MKKSITLVTSVLLSITLFSQTDKSTQELDKLLMYYNASNDAVKEKDYEKSLIMLDSLLYSYDQMSTLSKNRAKGFLGSVYYNRACYKSMLNETEEAVTDFEKAVEFNWNNYRHALQDSDLDNLRGNTRFEAQMEILKKKGDFLQILKDSPEYSNEIPKETIKFTYQSASAPELSHLRQYFNLDSIAGNGDEISQIKNLLTWVHNRVRHDGNSDNPSPRNTMNIVKVCDTEKRGVNCRMMAIMLNECYLAMGFKSRYLICMPQTMVNDCHVINSVYSQTLGKWLWMDPTFNAYVSDEKGNLLSITEVRERLRSDAPLVLNEDANWNNENKQTKEYYLDSYMAKNLYWIQANLNNEYNVETSKNTNGYLNLFPQNYMPKENPSDYKTTNDKFFWEEL